MLATYFKQVGTGTTKTWKVVECSKNTRLEHFTGQQIRQIHWQQVIVSWFRYHHHDISSIMARKWSLAQQFIVYSFGVRLSRRQLILCLGLLSRLKWKDEHFEIVFAFSFVVWGLWGALYCGCSLCWHFSSPLSDSGASCLCKLCRLLKNTSYDWLGFIVCLSSLSAKSHQILWSPYLILWPSVGSYNGQLELGVSSEEKFGFGFKLLLVKKQLVLDFKSKLSLR